MNTAIILSGGIGTRVGSDIPKQYIKVHNQPIFAYSMAIFENHSDIDRIIVVADNIWHDYINDYIKSLGITKFYDFALPGRTRQHSIYNGLKCAARICKDEDVVIIHDAVRPLVSPQIISDCISGSYEEDGAMPVIHIHDTVYQSVSGRVIDQLLKREELFAGQAPEGFRFGKYYQVHNSATDEEIGSSSGSSEIAHKNGMRIKLIEGSSANFKITTKEDLVSFEAVLAKEGQDINI